MSEFDAFSAEALQFLESLKANNTREWFSAQKSVYESEIKEPAKRFSEAMERSLGDLTGHPHVGKIFRIHRDVRFSKDKTPYNAHLHIAFRPEGLSEPPPMWFFGLSPGKLTLGCGVFQYDKQALSGFRDAMAGPMGAELIQLGEAMRARGFRLGEPDLQRVPAGFDKDHPNGEALRRKGFAVWIDRTDPAYATGTGLVGRTTDEFDALMPVFKLLTRIH